MRYIIPTEDEIKELNKLFMPFDNAQVNLEYCLDKVLLGINEYMLVPGVMAMLSDISLGVVQDRNLYERLMSVWLKLIIKIHYYIVTADMQLPILEFKLQHNDICVITEG